MENKTIGYINSKAWYRLIKVLFVIGFLIVLVGFNFVIFSQGVKTIDRTNTIIQCNVFDHKSFSVKSINLSLNSKDFVNGSFDYKLYFESYNDSSIQEILNGCAGNSPKYLATINFNNDIYYDQRMVEIENKYGLIGVGDHITSEQIATITPDLDTYKQETVSLYGNEKARYLDFSFHLFDIAPAYTYNPFLEWFLIGNFVILFIFEAIRRIFYYIVLGTLRPKKH
jgi:hypothetical protein